MAEQKRWTRRPENSTWGDYGADDQLGRLHKLKAAGIKRVTIMWDGEEAALVSALDAGKLISGLGLMGAMWALAFITLATLPVARALRGRSAQTGAAAAPARWDPRPSAPVGRSRRPRRRSS